MLDKIHWLGHAGFYIESSEIIIYLDPYQIKTNLPKADIILISHGHFDHCSIVDINKIYKSGTLIIGPLAVAKKIKQPVQAINPGSKINLKNIEVEATPAYNLDKSFHPKHEGNLGFIVTADNTRIYYAGDTDVIPEIKTINADIIILPVCGIYTMDAKEAAELANIINPKIGAIPMHWGSVTGTLQDAQAFQKLCRVKVKIPEQEQ